MPAHILEKLSFASPVFLSDSARHTHKLASLVCRRTEMSGLVKLRPSVNQDTWDAESLGVQAGTRASWCSCSPSSLHSPPADGWSSALVAVVLWTVEAGNMSQHSELPKGSLVPVIGVYHTHLRCCVTTRTASKLLGLSNTWWRVLILDLKEQDVWIFIIGGELVTSGLIMFPFLRSQQ